MRGDGMLKIAMLAGLTLALTGCLRYHADVKEGSLPFKPAFELKEGLWARKAPPLHGIAFYRTNGQREIVWGIYTDTEYTAILGELTYGTVPPGFKEYYRAKPLKIGHEYQIAIYNGDYGGGPSFKITEKDGKPGVLMID
jgi:hypothetical protein